MPRGRTVKSLINFDYNRCGFPFFWWDTRSFAQEIRELHLFLSRLNVFFRGFKAAAVFICLLFEKNFITIKILLTVVIYSYKGSENWFYSFMFSAQFEILGNSFSWSLKFSGKIFFLSYPVEMLSVNLNPRLMLWMNIQWDYANDVCWRSLEYKFIIRNVQEFNYQSPMNQPVPEINKKVCDKMTQFLSQGAHRSSFEILKYFQIGFRNCKAQFQLHHSFLHVRQKSLHKFFFEESFETQGMFCIFFCFVFGDTVCGSYD